MIAKWIEHEYPVTLSGSYVSFSSGSTLGVRYTKSSTVTLIPASGYYFESMSCSNGYTVTGFHAGTAYYTNQTVTITNNTYPGEGSCTVTMHRRSYSATKHEKSCSTGECKRTSSAGCSFHHKYTDDIGREWGECTCPDSTFLGTNCSHCVEYVTEDCSWYSCDQGGYLSGTTCYY